MSLTKSISPYPELQLRSTTIWRPLRQENIYILEGPISNFLLTQLGRTTIWRPYEQEKGIRIKVAQTVTQRLPNMVTLYLIVSILDGADPSNFSPQNSE